MNTSNFMQNLPPSISVYYDKHSRNWVAFYRSAYGEQIGDCAYGASKASVIFNLTS
jgi:hypothetical protein